MDEHTEAAAEQLAHHILLRQLWVAHLRREAEPVVALEQAEQASIAEVRDVDDTDDAMAAIIGRLRVFWAEVASEIDRL